MKGLVHLGMAIALCLFPAAAQAWTMQKDQFADVAGWELEEFRETISGEKIHTLEMERNHGPFSLSYRIKAGAEREVTVLRKTCGTVTDANGGQAFGNTLYVTAPDAKAAVQVREALKTAAADYHEHCPPAPAELDAALAGFDQAFTEVESWARLRPLPAVEAWAIGGGWSPRGDYISRTEPAVTIHYYVPEQGNGPGFVSLELTECGDAVMEGPLEQEVSRAGTPAQHHAAAKAALEAKLAQAAGKCAWPPDTAPRLAQGFEEAQARAETERTPAP